MSYCKYKPDAPNGKPSKLFDDLVTFTHSREMAKHAWGFTQTQLFKSEFTDIEKDENGEPTYEALSRILNLDSILKDTTKEWNRAIKLGIIDKKGVAKQYDLAETALAKAREFNDSATKRVVVVTQDENGKYNTELRDNTPMNIVDSDRNESRRNLNKALLTLLQKLGFNVEFVNDPTSRNFFDPLLAEKNVQNLRTVIRLSNDEVGLNAMSEEISHFILAGLTGTELKDRIDAAFTDDVVRRILGEDYDKYAKEYANSTMPVSERLREEAEGKAMASILKGDGIVAQPPAQNLFERLWNKAKAMFRKLTQSDIDNAIINAQSVINPVANLVKTGEVSTILDRKQIEAHERMYDLSEKTDNAYYLAQDGEALLSKKLYILNNTSSSEDPKKLIEDIKATRKALENSRYDAACYRVLSYIGKDIKSIMLEADRLGYVYDKSSDLNVIAYEAGLVHRMTTAVQAYEPYLKTLASLNTLIKRGEIEMSPEWADPIVMFAKDYLAMIGTIQDDIRSMRLSVLKQLVSMYYGDNGKKPEWFTETDKNKWISVDSLLRGAEKDISWWDTNIFSAGDSLNPLINVLHRIVVSQQSKRNNIIGKYTARMQEADRKLRDAGYSNDFIYQTDEKGNPTGYYVAPVDMARYERARAAFVASLDESDLDYYEQQRAIDKWEQENTEEIEITLPDGTTRKEILPSRKDYGVDDFQKGWSQEQKDYYDFVIEMKAEMDTMLPGSMQTLYLAPQVRKSVTQMFDKGGKGVLGTFWGKWKKEFSVVDDNEDYGKNITSKDKNGYKTVLTDFSGKPIKRVPIYFVHKLKDGRDLSTDGTRAMFSYITMAVNYSEMNKLAQAMQLMQDHVQTDYEVTQTSGGKPMIDMFRSVGREFSRKLRKTGFETNVAEAATRYIDRQIFNETKEEMGTKSILGVNFNLDTLFNLFMRLTSVARMGFNALSGITNATQGETQMICEANANRFFNVKDLGWSKKEYGKLLASYMGNFNAADRHDKMYMLINQFNSSEDYFRDMRDKDFNKSALKRVLGRGNVYFLNTMGEHYLHTSGMLAILHHEKVTRVGKPDEVVSLYDVIKQVHDKNGWHLELDSDIRFVDKNRAFLNNCSLRDKDVVTTEDRDELFENLAIYINKINADMHGGYSEAEKGNANQKAIWRAILQFRQWMPGMYNKMYSGSYYDSVLGQQREGSYTTAFKWVAGLLHDMKNMSLKAAIENNNLTDTERRRVTVALSQACLFILLAVGLVPLTAGWKDEDDRKKRLLSYQIRRLEMETGALVPWPTSFVKNIFTLIQSPAAGVKTLETLSQAFDLAHLAFWSESSYIKSGRFKGWWKPAKALWTSTPIYNIQRLVDMDDYNYMFNIFN